MDKSENVKYIGLSIIVLSISIVLSTFIIRKPLSLISNLDKQNVIEQETNKDILSFSGAAVYLNVSEDKLTSIIETSIYLDGNGIPYFMIDDNIIFSKTALEKWIVHSAENKFTYQ